MIPTRAHWFLLEGMANWACCSSIASYTAFSATELYFREIGYSWTEWVWLRFYFRLQLWIALIRREETANVVVDSLVDHHRLYFETVGHAKYSDLRWDELWSIRIVTALITAFCFHQCTFDPLSIAAAYTSAISLSIRFLKGWDGASLRSNIVVLMSIMQCLCRVPRVQSKR